MQLLIKKERKFTLFPLKHSSALPCSQGLYLFRTQLYTSGTNADAVLSNQTHLLLILRLHGNHSHSTCSAPQPANATWQSPVSAALQYPNPDATHLRFLAGSLSARRLWKLQIRRFKYGRRKMEKAGGCSLGPPPGNTSCPASSASVTEGTPTPAGPAQRSRELWDVGLLFGGSTVAQV